MNREFFLVDVFTDRPHAGNQLAVLPRAEGLTTAEMQAWAAEFGFSETTFVLPPSQPGCDWQVRIFTPKTELPLAGHPTLGTAKVLQHLGMVTGPRTVLQLGVGPTAVDFGPDGGLTMALPLPKFGPIFEVPEKIAPLLGLQAADLSASAEGQIVSCGVACLILPVKDRATLRRAKINLEIHDQARSQLHFDGVLVWVPGEQPQQFHVRFLAPALGVADDPATGSAAGPFVCYCLRQGVTELVDGASEVIIHQGDDLGRPSRLKARATFDKSFTGVTVSGQAVLVGQGQLFTPPRPD